MVWQNTIVTHNWGRDHGRWGSLAWSGCLVQPPWWCLGLSPLSLPLRWGRPYSVTSLSGTAAVCCAALCRPYCLKASCCNTHPTVNNHNVHVSILVFTNVIGNHATFPDACRHLHNNRTATNLLHFKFCIPYYISNFLFFMNMIINIRKLYSQWYLWRSCWEGGGRYRLSTSYWGAWGQTWQNYYQLSWLLTWCPLWFGRQVKWITRAYCWLAVRCCSDFGSNESHELTADLLPTVLISGQMNHMSWLLTLAVCCSSDIRSNEWHELTADLLPTVVLIWFKWITWADCWIAVRCCSDIR